MMVAERVGGVFDRSSSSSSVLPDYSAQWAEYYRSIGKVKEAEALEQQMKQKVWNNYTVGPY